MILFIFSNLYPMDYPYCYYMPAIQPTSIVFTCGNNTSHRFIFVSLSSYSRKNKIFMKDQQKNISQSHVCWVQLIMFPREKQSWGVCVCVCVCVLNGGSYNTVKKKACTLFFLNVSRHEYIPKVWSKRNKHADNQLIYFILLRRKYWSTANTLPVTRK